MEVIAYIESDFPEKFGVPRQSGMVNSLVSKIVFVPEYRDDSSLRGLEGFEYIWLIWDFSLSHKEGWSPTVRPPRLGGNKRMGVFATRSPNRPNPIGLSSVKLLKIEKTEKEGSVIYVSGADLANGTPIYDIKPYLPMSDSHPGARAGFAKDYEDYRLTVDIPYAIAKGFPKEKLTSLIEVLSLDPRPSYHSDAEREYGFSFSGYNIKFKVCEETLCVTEITPCE